LTLHVLCWDYTPVKMGFICTSLDTKTLCASGIDVEKGAFFSGSVQRQNISLSPPLKEGILFMVGF
jgi:hypothetical protein